MRKRKRKKRHVPIGKRTFEQVKKLRRLLKGPRLFMAPMVAPENPLALLVWSYHDLRLRKVRVRLSRTDVRVEDVVAFDMAHLMLDRELSDTLDEWLRHPLARVKKYAEQCLREELRCFVDKARAEICRYADICITAYSIWQDTPPALRARTFVDESASVVNWPVSYVAIERFDRHSFRASDVHRLEAKKIQAFRWLGEY